MAKARFEVSGISDSLKPLLSGTRSSNDMRNCYGSLHQTDFAPLRARAQGYNVLNVWVNPAIVEGYYQGVLNVSGVPCTYASGVSPTTWVPASNARIDILHVNAAEPNPALFWVSGTAAASPTIPSISTSGTPIAAVYHRAGATRILDSDDSTHSYLYRDMRPLYSYQQGYTPSSSNALSGSIIQSRRSVDRTARTITAGTGIPDDNTIPQSGEAGQFSQLSVSITPSAIGNIIELDGIVQCNSLSGNGNTVMVGVWENGQANCLGLNWFTNDNANLGSRHVPIFASITASGTSAVTFDVRLSHLALSTNINVNQSISASTFGGVPTSYLRAKEIKA